MCIRDRVGDDDDQVRAAKGQVLEVTQVEVQLHSLLRSFLILAAEPVSYTHLSTVICSLPVISFSTMKAMYLLLRRFSIKPCTLTVLPISF